MDKIKDMRGVLLQEGDVIAYGRSSRHHPINIGTIEGFEEVSGTNRVYILVLGKGNSKVAKIPSYHSGRMIVLPSHYME
jgi:hypothetical protein